MDKNNFYFKGKLKLRNSILHCSFTAWRVRMIQTLWWSYNHSKLTRHLYLCLQNLARATSRESVERRTAFPFRFPAWEQTSCTCGWKKEARSAICCDLQQLACKGQKKKATGPYWERWSSLDQVEESPRPSPVWRFWNVEWEGSTRCQSSTTRWWVRSGRVHNRERQV